MASQGVAATSRLAQMQMRFQKKQMQEREQKRIEITVTSAAESVGDVAAAVGQKTMGNGKVRQMFDERRRGAGIDRSHPLKPIATIKTTTATSMPRTSKSTSTLTATASRSSGVGVPPAARRQPASMAARQPLRRSTLTRSEAANGSRDLNFNHSGLDSVDNGAFPKQFSSMSLTESRLNGASDHQNNNNSSTKSRTSISREVSSNSIKLNPLVTKKSPSVAVTRAPARQATPNAQRAPRSVTATMQKPVSGSATVKTPPKSSGDRMSTNSMVVRQAAPAAGMSACKYCSRHFNEDRLRKHEQICQKMMNTKRRVFDASKHRVQGTEAEKYVRKPPNSRTRVSQVTYSSAAAISGSSTNGGPKKNNWRKKHEDFIAAIRAAKQVQSHLARGGKLSDLPPPPPSENPDYVQCPHCKRRFNEAAAERHIPKCANMQHNKPKPGSASALRKR